MHAEILAPSFPPPYAHGQLMHYKGSYNQPDQLKPPLHTIHNDFSSYPPAPSIEHYGSVQFKEPMPAHYPEKPAVAANFVAAVYQTPTPYEDITYNSSNSCYQPTIAPALTESSQPVFDASHVQASVFVVAPDSQAFYEGFAAKQNGGEPYEHGGDCASSHQCHRPDREPTTATNFHHEHLDCNQPPAPALIVFPEPQNFPPVPVPYEHSENFPRQQPEFENIPTEPVVVGFEQHQRPVRSRSQTPKPAVVTETQPFSGIIVLEHDGTEFYEPAGIYPCGHQRQPSECEKIPIDTSTASFDQSQPLGCSRSQTPKQAVVTETQPFSGIIVLEHNGTEFYEATKIYPCGHQRQPSECEKIPVDTSTASFDQSQPLGRSRSHTPTSIVPCDVHPERLDIDPPRQQEPGPYGGGTDFAPGSYHYPSPASPPLHQAGAGVSHGPMTIRESSRPQTPTPPILSPIRAEPVLYPPPTPGFRVITETQPDFYLLEHDPMTDEEASASVHKHFSQRNTNREQERAEQELSRLILSSPLMTGCLGEVVHWANILFFEGKLTVAKVDLQWSDPLDPRFDPQSGGLIGTTELKPDHTGGFQTRIILSRQRLMSGTYDQRLVLSAILHECVHAYLFICRGFEAMENGGHTDGFKEIARLIDSWVDGDGSYLRLHSTEADLESFRASAGHGWNCGRAAWGQDNGFLWTSSRL